MENENLWKKKKTDILSKSAKNATSSPILRRMQGFVRIAEVS